MLWDLYFLPRGMSEHTAKGDDITMVACEGENAFVAANTPDAMRMTTAGYYVADSVPHGSLSLLRLRVMDRTRVVLDDADRPPGFETGNTAARRSRIPFFPR